MTVGIISTAAMTPRTMYALRQSMLAMMALAMRTNTNPPAVLPARAIPVAKPRFSLNQLFISSPQGTTATPPRPKPTSAERM